MAFVGNKYINIPDNVKVKFNQSNSEVEISGPKGVLVNVFLGVNIVVNEKDFNVSLDDTLYKVNDIDKMYGLYYVLLKNMVTGVSTGFKKNLELIGKGYKATLLTPKILELDLGYSHKVLFCLPKEIECSIIVEKTKNILTISGNDKCLVGQISAKIKALRPVEPYKGKGFRYSGEYVKVKVGKKVK